MDWKKIFVKHIPDKSVSMTQKEMLIRQPLLPLTPAQNGQKI